MQMEFNVQMEAMELDGGTTSESSLTSASAKEWMQAWSAVLAAGLPSTA